MVALFQLTSEPGWETRYQITVYQLGWRLGGKGASGRNQAEGHRIEEHGLHMWWGFYDHAFDVMRRCYTEIASPHFSLEQCFQPQNHIAFLDSSSGTTRLREVVFPENNLPRGFSPQTGTSQYHASMALCWLDFLRQNADRDALASVLGAEESARAIDVALALCGMPLRGGRQLIELLDQPDIRQKIDEQLRGAVQFLTQGSRVAVGGSRLWERPLASALAALRRSLRRPDAVTDERSHKAEWYFLWLDFLLTTAIGLLSDGVVSGRRALDDLDEEEFSVWLKRHGLGPATLSSVLMRGLYDAAFCFRNGDPALPDIGSGVILKTFLRMFLSYKGSYMFRMVGGMGDVIFAPLYLALQRRAEQAARLGYPDGLRFRFFHRVDALGLSADSADIETIEIAEQARTRQGDYRPLIEHPQLGLPVWPSEPLYDQLEAGELLRQGPDGGQPYNLESSFCSWPDAARSTLRKGQDFDLVVLGISLGALRRICAPLVAASPAWAGLVNNVKSIRTLAAQIWLDEPIEKLGFTGRKLPVIAGFHDPLNSFADMSHTLPLEPPAQGARRPGSVLYFCGPMAEDPAAPEHADDGYPATQSRLVLGHLDELLASHGHEILPRARRGHEFAWDCLFDPQQRPGRQRLDAQYVRANIDPSERYNLSLAGTIKHRLRPDESGFRNLYLAGDWTRNGIDFGCVESASVSGFQAARAVARQVAAHGASPDPRKAGQRPAFIEIPAMQVYQPPYVIGDMVMQFYALSADPARLQRACDRYLNAVTPHWRFSPLAPVMMVVLGSTGINRSIAGPEASYGFGTELSLTFAIPVQRKVGERVDIGMFPVIAIVDNSLSLSSGREIHGFAKSIGWFSGDMKTPGADVTVETMVYERHRPDSLLVRRPLLSVRHGGQVAASSPGLEGRFAPGLKGVGAMSEAAALGWVRDHLQSNDLTIFNLLQLRSPEFPGHCRLQKVTRSSFRVTRFADIGLLPRGNTLEVQNHDSHAVLTDLGALSGGETCLLPLAGVWLKMDSIQTSVLEEAGYSESLGHPGAPSAMPRVVDRPRAHGQVCEPAGWQTPSRQISSSRHGHGSPRKPSATQRPGCWLA